MAVQSNITSCLLYLTGMTAIAVAPAHAQDTGDDVAFIPIGPTIGGVHVEGADVLGPAAFSAPIEAAIGQEATPEALQHLANAISEAARDRGYVFATVSIAPQQVETGIVTVRLDPGLIDEVRINGSDNRHLHALLAPLAGKEGRPADVERLLLLAEDMPGIAILRTRFVREGARGILVVDVKERPISGSIALDNWGNPSYGPVRLRSTVSAHNVLSEADSLTAQVNSTIGQPQELLYGSLQYSISPGLSGLKLGIVAGAGGTRPGNFSDLHLVGDSLHLATFGSFPLKRSSASSIWINAEAAYMQVDQAIFDDLVQRDRTASFTVSLTGYQKVAGGGLNWGAGVTQGLDLLGASREGDPLLSRSDGDGVFTKGTAWFNWFGGLTGGLSLRLAANGQIASRGLLATQEIGLGGPYMGRGYDYFERSGDDGIMGLIELRHQLALPWHKVRWAHAYIFADGGYVSNKRQQFGEGELASAGGGLRAGIGQFELGLEGAQPLTGHRYSANGASTQMTFIVGYNF